MLFMLSSRPKPGVTQEQMIEHLTTQLHPATWDLIRHGVLSNVYYKVGDPPGFFALLSAPSLGEAEKMINELERATGDQGRLAVFDVEIVPVKQFPDFRLRHEIKPSSKLAISLTPPGRLSERH